MTYKATLPTPISILETYFKRKLTLKDIAVWKEVTDDTWVDFAKYYLAQMKAGFTHEAMAERIAEPNIRLYFDYLFGEDYDREIVSRYGKTPLLGHSQYPLKDVDYAGEGLTLALAPLKKHLLVADELYIPDNFYRCFDSVADTYDRHSWRSEPTVESSVHGSIAAILHWLPILAGLRELIVSGAINFLPYYVIPSFPYSSGNPFMTRIMGRLDIPRDPSIKPAGEARIDLSSWNEPPKIPEGPPEHALNCEGAAYAWINARLLGLDPVFADKKTWQWAAGIKFRDETKAQATTDLMSIDILPLGDKKGLTVQDIVSMRRGERVFKHVRDTLIGCKEYVSENVSESASSEFVSKTCREYIRDHLNPEERLKTLKFLDSNLAAGTVLAIAVGAAFMLANPWVGLLVPAALTPKSILAAEAKFDPRVRAAARLEALL
jgi:hypothetical protein